MTHDVKSWLYCKSADELADELEDTETELANLKELLKRAVEVVREKTNDYYRSSAPGAEGLYCAECNVLKTKGHRNALTCGVAIAEALLPDMEEALKEKQ